MARPKSEVANRAAIDATLGLLMEAGIEGVNWEEVAARSGVAKSTLYRHFADREDMICQAFQSAQVEHVTPDTGSLAADLRSLFSQFSSCAEEVRLNQILPIVIDAARRDDRFECIADAVFEQRRRPIRTVLKLAQLRGELASDLDLEEVVALVIGPFAFKRVVEQQPITPEFADRVLTWALAGLGVTSTG